jgi:hypothetical protein
MGTKRGNYVTLVNSAALAFPKDGYGNTSLIRASGTSAGATTTYTATTVTDSGGWAPVAVARGDYVFAASGEWGIVQSTSTNTLTVDKWRFATTGEFSPATRTPAAGGAAAVYGPNITAYATELAITSVSIIKAGAINDTFAITDAKGTSISGLTFQMPAANPVPVTYYFGEPDEGGGIILNQPFGLKVSVAGMTVVVAYTIIK